MKYRAAGTPPVATREDCLEALRAVATTLGKSPTKAEYEELGARPSASTILRICGGWNDAKEQAGLATNTSTGTRVANKPEGVSLPEGTDWTKLSQDQRWHYRHVSENTERTLQRRQRLRAWVNERKRAAGCAECGEDDPRCLDYHHTDPDEKRRNVSELVTYGHGRESLRAEMVDCEVRCANCHRREHTGDNRWTEIRRWLHEYKREQGCRRCDHSDPRCLVFHHDGSKNAAVSTMVTTGRPDEVIRSEATDCVVLCANCHRKEHAELSEPDG